MNRRIVLIFSLILFAAGPAVGQDRDTKVRNDRQNLEPTGLWIYDDLERGYDEAKKTNKPLLVVFRCIP